MKLEDYVISQAGITCPDILSDYTKLSGINFTVWIVNLFGDIIMVNSDESISYFDSSSGEMNVIAKDRDSFCELIDAGNNANDWLMIPLVDKCKSAGLFIGKNQCYSFKHPPVLGGEYLPGNVHVCDIAVHYGFMSDITNQIADLPDGAKVRINIINS